MSDFVNTDVVHILFLIRSLTSSSSELLIDSSDESLMTGALFCLFIDSTGVLTIRKGGEGFMTKSANSSKFYFGIDLASDLATFLDLAGILRFVR